MNEPKFRAWDSKNGLMWNVTDIMWRKGEIVYIRGTTTFNGKEDYPIGTSFGMDSVSRADVTLLPYTGLKDRDDVEIYEGDIVTVFEYLNGKLWEGHIHNAEVVFVEGQFTIEPAWRGQSLRQEVEVLGNVHENQELLNG